MKKKYSLILDDDFAKYCELNGIADVEQHARLLFNKAFALEKYGPAPIVLPIPTSKPQPTPVVTECPKPVVEQTPPPTRTTDLYGD